MPPDSFLSSCFQCFVEFLCPEKDLSRIAHQLIMLFQKWHGFFLSFLGSRVA